MSVHIGRGQNCLFSMTTAILVLVFTNPVILVQSENFYHKVGTGFSHNLKRKKILHFDPSPKEVRKIQNLSPFVLYCILVMLPRRNYLAVKFFAIIWVVMLSTLWIGHMSHVLILLSVLVVTVVKWCNRSGVMLQFMFLFVYQLSMLFIFIGLSSLVWKI